MTRQNTNIRFKVLLLVIASNFSVGFGEDLRVEGPSIEFRADSRHGRELDRFGAQ